MAEIKIYLTNDFHREHLQEASRDLLEQNLVVIDRCRENLEMLSPKLSADIVQTRVRQLVDPYYVSKKVIANWNKREGWVSRMLVKAKAMSYPEHTDSKLGEQLHSINTFTATSAALGFFDTTEARLKTLLRMQAPQQLSFLGYGSFAFVESRILRKAVYNGVFLTNRKPIITPKPFLN